LLLAVTPPGFATFNGNTTQCPLGWYRADWKPSNQATNCLSCGTDVYAEQTDRVKVFNLLNPNNVTYLAITSSSDDCCKCLLVGFSNLSVAVLLLADFC
jgi:hypothetical protein